jgi:hypothetical protein
MAKNLTKKSNSRNWNPKHKSNKRKKRPFPVVVFLSAEELDLLQEKWSQHGFATRADYIRFMLLHGVIDEDTVHFHVDASIAQEKMRGL